jgi:hypothetical protein
MPRCRPFKLVDGMILIAAAALWMALMRPVWDQLERVRIEIMAPKPLRWQSYVGIVSAGFYVALLVLSLAYLAMRLISPRPPRSDLIRQPGMLLLGRMLAIMAVLMLLALFVPLLPLTNIVIALALASSWLVATPRNRSRAEPGWIEAIGRSLGVGWIVYFTASYPLYLLFYR